MLRCIVFLSLWLPHTQANDEDITGVAGNREYFEGHIVWAFGKIEKGVLEERKLLRADFRRFFIQGTDHRVPGEAGALGSGRIVPDAFEQFELA